MKRVTVVSAVFLCVFSAALAQAPGTMPRQPVPGPWRMVGQPPCLGPEGHTLRCPPTATPIVAVRAGRLFDSATGQMLSRQVVIVDGERIAEVGPEAQVRIPSGAQVIDLGAATVLPGHIDMHSHMFNNPKPGMRGVDWIKLYPGGAYSFTTTGEASYVTTYPLLDTMVQKKLDFDPTLARYTASFMDDNDDKNTGGKYRMIPIFERAVKLAVATQGLRTMVGSGVDGSAFPHGTQNAVPISGSRMVK